MSRPSTVDRLAALPALSDIPREQLRWLVEHGRLHSVEHGAEIRGDDDTPMGLYVLMSGRFSVRMDQGGVTREMREVLPGRITGYLPYSRITAPRGYLVADGPVEYLEIAREDIEEMTRECYELTASCVHEMLDRVRVFKADDKDQEKMAALGRLAAGLAHELNNPASAVARAAGELDSVREDLVAAARAVGATGLEGATGTVDGTEAVDATGAVDGTGGALASLEATVRAGPAEATSALDRADLEDRMMEWLDDHGIDPDLAYPLVERGLSTTHIETAARGLDDRQLGVALRYLAADATARDLTASIASAAARIHALVSAVKKHTHMDRAPAAESIMLEGHLADTVALMRSKASRKAVVLDLRVDTDVPAVEGSVADLNQVWMHLVDNAIDAASEDGRVLIEVARGSADVVIRVVDDGPGIPVEDRERIFEPFFTTKDVGQGRGLGLDVVRTVVSRHRGTVDLSSEPGRTEFRVTLPACRAPA